MDLSVKEKCLIASLLVTLVLFGNYFQGVISQYSADRDTAFNLTGLIKVVVFVVILEIIIHSFFAAPADSKHEDERDKLIEKVSYRNGYWMLSIGVWVLISQIVIATLVSPERFGIADSLNHTIDFLSPFILGNVLIFIFIVSEVTIFITQLIYYRRGV